MTPGAPWTPRHWAVLAAGLVLAVAIRIVLLPTPGLAGDLNEFAGFVHLIVTNGLGRLFDFNMAFPPVIAYLWGFLGLVTPAFRTVTDAADPAIRVILKTPPSLVDLGLAAGVAFALRARPWWAVAAALGIALHPAVIDDSALFGQYESIYVFFGLVAYLLVVRGRNALAAIVLAIAVMTKLQALPFLVPFAAWFLARNGVVASLRLALIGLATIALVWLPFLQFGGPAHYLSSVAYYQNGAYGLLSLRAWNPWWLLQTAAGGGDFLVDGQALVGPLTPRFLGLAVTTLLAILVAYWVYRTPTPRVLAWSLAAITLASFIGLTTMHERYSYPAFVFLALAFPDRRALALWIAFGIVFTLNLLAAIPPTPAIGAALPVGGLLGVIGSLAMTAIAIATLAVLRTESVRANAGPTPVAIAAETSAGP